MPQCSGAYELHANYRGGVLIYLEAPTGGFPGGSTTDKLMMIQDGSLLWQSTLPATDSDGSPLTAFSFAVDLNGDVAWQYEVHQAVSVNGSTPYFPAVKFTLLNGWTGTPLVHTLLAGDGSTYGYRATNRDNFQVALAKDTVYVAAQKCSSLSTCSGDTDMFAIKVTGAHADYPRGATLPYNQPWLNYVAMGGFVWRWTRRS